MYTCTKLQRTMSHAVTSLLEGEYLIDHAEQAEPQRGKGRLKKRVSTGGWKSRIRANQREIASKDVN